MQIHFYQGKKSASRECDYYTGGAPKMVHLHMRLYKGRTAAYYNSDLPINFILFYSLQVLWSLLLWCAGCRTMPGD